MRNWEKQLLAAKATRQMQRAAGDPALPDLAEQYRQLTNAVERLPLLAPSARHRPAGRASLT